MKRYRIIYEGQVQGVGMRGTLFMLARYYNVTGYARNMANGNVECEIQGSEDACKAFINASLERDSWIVIYDYAIKEKEVVLEEKAFTIKY